MSSVRRFGDRLVQESWEALTAQYLISHQIVYGERDRGAEGCTSWPDIWGRAPVGNPGSAVRGVAVIV